MHETSRGFSFPRFAEGGTFFEGCVPATRRKQGAQDTCAKGGLPTQRITASRTGTMHVRRSGSPNRWSQVV